MQMIILLLLAMLLCVVPAAADTGTEDLLLTKGLALIKVGDYQRAVREFRQLTRVNPLRDEAWLGMGTALLRLGNTGVVTDVEVLREAVESLTTALRINPDLNEARFALGEAYLALQEPQKAAQEQLALRDRDPRRAAELAGALAAYRKPTTYRELGGTAIGGEQVTDVTIVQNLVLVPVTLHYGQRNTQVQLALDTGASITVINAAVAAQLGIDLTGKPAGKIQVVGGALIGARAVRLDRVVVGPHAQQPMTVAIIDHRGAAVPFDGLLGMDFLKHHRHHLDYKGKVIRWVR
jgi:hypothetical protein